VTLRDRAAAAVGLLGICALVGCSQADVVSELRSLSGSEDTVFLCRDASGRGHPIADCPDPDTNDDADPAKQLSLMALVSQTVTDEVAVVDVTAGHVVDVDPSLPGYGFLRVGARPVSLATTPGGAATFVATADVGRNGLFALPTTCLAAPDNGEGRLGLTTWPACRLNETPGEIAVLVEPNADLCMPAEWDGDEVASDAYICAQGDRLLSEEGGPQGRRKLVVSFPDSGKLRVYDAQALLDRAPGTFVDCQAELELELKADVPQGVTQILPPDLAPSADNMCSEVAAPTPPKPARRSPQPAGFAVAEDRLYIADQAAPVIHVLDTSSPCSLTELPSLLPMSLREPDRVVVTRRVAVSPLTPAGQRFVYAIDMEDQPGASVMAFDVSPGSTNPTPLVRPGSVELPGEKPDRLWLSASLAGSSAKDVAFAYRDIPYVNESTGTAEFGVRCDPRPGATGPGALALPSADYSSGARAGLLRGLFGFVMLTNGVVAVIDVDDLDADCRRPIAANSTDTPDFRGCVNDPSVGYFTSDGTAEGTRLVTNEVSCRIVEPQQVRSSRLALIDNTNGIRAPSLRSFPQLTLPASALITASEDRARLLGVPYAGPQGDPLPTEVYVGSTRYDTSGSGTELLPTDPNGSESEQLQALNSVVLPPLEPRAYAADDTFTVTYEGSYAGDRQAGFLNEAGELRDDGLSYCNAGVYDVATMTDYAARELGLREAAAAAFGAAHADYVQLTTPLLDEKDSYWSRAPLSRNRCLELFGADDADLLLPARDLDIVSAFGDRLQLEVRTEGVAPEAVVTMSDVRACFPSAQRYRLRARRHWVLSRASSGFRHDVVESGADRRCVRSCNPLKKWDKSRVFEISRRPAGGMCDAADSRVGCAAPDEEACVMEKESGGVQVGDKGAECIFDGLTARFALYRGRVASVRDEAFAWQTSGGFSPLVMSLAAISTAVSPQSIQYLPQAERIAVVDGSSQGLSLFSLDTFAAVKPSPFY
jgi:hypothetical protein